LRIVAEAVGSDCGGGVESEHAAKAPITTARIPDLIQCVSFASRKRRSALHDRKPMQGHTPDSRLLLRRLQGERDRPSQ
jgi:hypothetical protein